MQRSLGLMDELFACTSLQELESSRLPSLGSLLDYKHDSVLVRYLAVLQISCGKELCLVPPQTSLLLSSFFPSAFFSLLSFSTLHVHTSGYIRRDINTYIFANTNSRFILFTFSVLAYSYQLSSRYQLSRSSRGRRDSSHP